MCVNACRRIVDLSSNSSASPVDQNLPDTTIPSSLTTSTTYAQVVRTTRQEVEPAPGYSRLGPAYAKVDPERQQGGQNQISSNVRERYEFVETHNMETDKQPFENEDSWNTHA